MPARPSPLAAAARTGAVPVLLGAAAVAEAWLNPDIAGGSVLPAVFAGAMALPLYWRKAQSLAALLGSLLVFGASEVRGPGTLSEAAMPFVVLIVAMYSAGAMLRGGALVGAAAASCTVISITIVYDDGADLDSLAYALGVIAAVFVAGRLVGQRTREAGRLASEKEQLETERDERERAAVARERMRIAQELHDLITHRVSAMVLQASAERRIAETHPTTLDAEDLTASLSSIERLGREAMTELRQLLGTLFHQGEEPRAPQPAVRDLRALVQQTAAVAPARLTITGTERALPPPLEVSLYRLTQEALSNAMRHAPGSHVDVTLDYQPRGVGLTVRNTAGGPPGRHADGLGLGIPGMQERARQFGGTVSAGPTADGGFVVRAHLPIAATEEAR